MKNKNIVEEALELQSIGFSIIPIKNSEKKPLINWTEFQNRIATPEEIKKWFEMWPDAGIAIVTGQISGIIVFDIDAKYNRNASEFAMPVTVCVQTGGGGNHFYFKYPGKKVPNSSGSLFGEGIDLRGDGGYVVAPPSLHASGHNYQWSELCSPSETEIAEMPKWLIDKIYMGEQNSKLWGKDPSTVLPGTRNQTAASIAGKIQSGLDQGLWETIGWSGMLNWNKQLPEPLSETELRSVWESVGKYRKNKLNKPSKTSIEITCFESIQSEKISWLWPGYIARGKLTIISGDPGLGKSLTTIGLAATVSKGYPLPDNNSNAEVGDVLFLSAEDDPADTIRPRLDAAGADCSRIHILENVKVTDHEGNKTERGFSLKEDIKNLEEVLCTKSTYRLLVIDPISAYLDGIESHNNAEVRGLLAPLAKLAAKYKIAIVAVSHLNKNQNSDAIYRTMGSLAFVAAARAAYLVVKDKEDSSRRLFLPAKNNLAKDITGFAYSVVTGENEAPVIAWDPKPVKVDVATFFSQDKNKINEEFEENEAQAFLKFFLFDGPKPVDEIFKEGAKKGFSKKVLRTARENSGVITYKGSFQTGWFWTLEGEGAQKAQDALTKDTGTFEK